MGKIEEAIKSYDEAIKINPYEADAYNYKGDALSNDMKEDAIIAFDEAIKIYPNQAQIFQ